MLKYATSWAGAPGDGVGASWGLTVLHLLKTFIAYASQSGDGSAGGVVMHVLSCLDCHRAQMEATLDGHPKA